MEEDIKKYFISKDELNALLYTYWLILYGLDNSKGLTYHQLFKSKKSIIDTIPKVKKLNIDDYIVIMED